MSSSEGTKDMFRPHMFFVIINLLLLLVFQFEHLLIHGCTFASHVDDEKKNIF